MKNIINEFPICDSFTYLNTPYTGVLSTSVSSQVKKLEEEFRLKGSLFTDQYEVDLVYQTKDLIAEIYDAESEAVAILNNFSTGMNLILNDLPDRSKVVLLAQDYPSVNIPVKVRNFDVYEVDINLEMYNNLRQIFADVRPDYFIFSLTQFISGLEIDRQKLKQLKQEFPEVSFIADATQYCGTADFDFEDSPLDVFGTSGYKWLNAGLGNAFFLFKKEFLEQHKFTSIGSNSLDAKPDGNPRPTGFLEPGHYDVIAIARLKHALEFHYKTLGINRIESEIKSIAKLAKSEFLKRNLLDTKVIEEDTHQTIFSLKGEESTIHYLKGKGILSAYRGGRIRVGFHYFNTEDDLEHLLKALDDLA